MKVYIFTVRVTDDGIGDPLDDAVSDEYLPLDAIRDEIEKIDAAGIEAKVTRIQLESTQDGKLLEDIKLPYRSPHIK